MARSERACHTKPKYSDAAAMVTVANSEECMQSLTARFAATALTHAWTEFRRQPLPWLAMATVYVALAGALQIVPFIGYLVMVLLTPLMLAGALLTAQEWETNAANTVVASEWHERLMQRLSDAVAKLFRVFTDSDRALTAMVISTFTLGAVVLLQIIAQLLRVGGAALPAMAAGSVSASVWLPALLSLIFIWVVKLFLILLATLAVQLAVFRRDAPLHAMETAARICASQPASLALLALALLVPIVLVAYISVPIAYLVALAALPLYVLAMHFTFKTLYPQVRLR